MTDRDIFNAIITLPSDDSILLFDSLNIINKYSNKIKLIGNEKGEVYYTIPITDLLDNDITEEDITSLKNSSWKVQGDFLIKNM